MCTAGGSTITDAYRFDGWGVQVASTGSAVNPWRYRGLLNIGADTGIGALLDMDARDYSPQAGSFTQKDSVQGSAANPATMNRFLYALGNPATLVDPDGHYAEIPTNSGGGTVIQPKPVDPMNCHEITCGGYATNRPTSGRGSSSSGGGSSGGWSGGSYTPPGQQPAPPGMHWSTAPGLAGQYELNYDTCSLSRGSYSGVCVNEEELDRVINVLFIGGVLVVTCAAVCAPLLSGAAAGGSAILAGASAGEATLTAVTVAGVETVAETVAAGCGLVGACFGPELPTPAGPSVAYSRPKQYGGAATNGAAGRAIRQEAEGRLCPGCSQPMVSGTRTAPIPEHDPAIVVHYYEHEGWRLTPAEGRRYAVSPGAFNGALCATCQAAQGAALARYSQLMKAKYGL